MNGKICRIKPGETVDINQKGGFELSLEIKHKNYTVKIEPPEIYVNNESRGRSGHMSHAMAEFAPGKIIDFNSNCSAKRMGGHSSFGWVEYRISEDAGKTFSEKIDFPISIEEFFDGVYNISVEKAVACDNGRSLFSTRQNIRPRRLCFIHIRKWQ